MDSISYDSFNTLLAEIQHPTFDWNSCRGSRSSESPPEAFVLRGTDRPGPSLSPRSAQGRPPAKIAPSSASSAQTTAQSPPSAGVAKKSRTNAAITAPAPTGARRAVSTSGAGTLKFLPPETPLTAQKVGRGEEKRLEAYRQVSCLGRNGWVDQKMKIRKAKKQGDSMKQQKPNRTLEPAVGKAEKASATVDGPPAKRRRES